MRNIISYVFREKPDIGDDEAAQARWLTPKLRRAIVTGRKICERARKADPTDRIDCPSNVDFVGFWSYPLTYSVLGSRRYGDRAIVDVLYSWGKGTDYEGDQEVASFIFKLEKESWLLDDIYFFPGDYRDASSLEAELERQY